MNRGTWTLDSNRLVLYDPQLGPVSGSAVVDLVPASTGSSPRLRADGRFLDLSNPKLKPAQKLSTNVWVQYRGTLGTNGIVMVDEIAWTDNAISKGEEKLRSQTDYDPAAVPEDSHQSGASKFFKGVDPKQIPPFKDAGMQARVDRVGRSLIPAYQLALAADDPTRIDFRFQLVDEAKWPDAIDRPSGVILVPIQIVRRLPDDSELAAVLADNIATAIEKQEFRMKPAVHRMTAANVAGAAAGLVIPGAGIATQLTTAGVAKHLFTLELEQSGRVALCFMHDAGYDITKAPEAWWTLSTKEGKEPHRNAPPPRARNLYAELGTTWRATLQPASAGN
jgi:hypothetical protein